MVMAFAGNKADLEDKRKVTAEVSIVVFFQYSFYAMLAIKIYNLQQYCVAVLCA